MTMSAKTRRKADSRASKRDRFAPRKKTPAGPSPIVLVGGLVIAVAIIVGAAYALTRPSPATPAAASQPVKAATSGHAPYPQVVAVDGAVRLSAATFDDYNAHYYTYMHDDQPIEFFVLKSEDGVIRAAFNACDVCFQSLRGYSREGNEMVCNNCGLRFPANQINVIRGGCNPSPLDRALEGDTLIIQAEDIVTGLRYF
jgi:uncharacterized membrane protein